MRCRGDESGARDAQGIGEDDGKGAEKAISVNHELLLVNLLYPESEGTPLSEALKLRDTSAI